MLTTRTGHSVLAMNSVRAYAFCFLIYWTVGVLGVYKYQLKGGFQNGTKVYAERSLIGVAERASRHGYSVSEHVVQTEDGYLLTMFRLQRAGGGVKGPPVLLMHGLLQSAASWIDAGPGAALAYLIADAGHDLWLGNVRGSYYSRQHAWLDPDTHSQYWKFCVDEIGRYDLPASIDYILSQTGARKLNYIGFSQGGGTFLIMCSERPEYRDKVNIFIALAPATRLLHTKSIIFRFLVEYYEKHENELIKSGVWEALPLGGTLQSFLQNFCAISDVTGDMCILIKDVVDAPNLGSIAVSTMQIAVAGFPAGTSVHNLARYGQSYKTKNFQQFDYGPKQNLVQYGSEYPPVYNLSAVTLPTVVIYGRNDGGVDTKDVKWLVGKLPNVLEAFEIKDPSWTHMDVPLSRNIPKYLFPKISEYLNKFRK